jgi:hypothetical protein
MAQTKAKASSKRSAGSKKPQARSRGSTKKSANSRRQASSRKQPKSSKPAPVVAASNAADKATTAVGDTAAKATNAVGTAASKAKVPLIASGAALAGAAGGAALGVRQARRHRRRGFGKAARNAGTLGVQMGHLASELQRNREATNGQHRSPLEVVLEGLTARRSRA